MPFGLAMDATETALSQSEYNRRYYLANRERIRQQRKARRKQNPEAVLAANRAWREANRDKLRAAYAANKGKHEAKRREYYAANRERLKAYRKAYRKAHAEQERARDAAYRLARPHRFRDWYAANRASRNKWHAAYQRQREESNPSLRVYRRIVRMMSDAMRRHKAGRVVGSASRVVQLLGCDWPHFIAHVERQFAPGMTWANHGRSGWHFDHIRPLSSFDLTNEEQLLKGCHFTNVQPLWAAENIRKGAKIA